MNSDKRIGNYTYIICAHDQCSKVARGYQADDRQFYCEEHVAMNDATTQRTAAAQVEKTSASAVRGVARCMLYHTL